MMQELLDVNRFAAIFRLAFNSHFQASFYFEIKTCRTISKRYSIEQSL